MTKDPVCRIGVDEEKAAKSEYKGVIAQGGKDERGDRETHYTAGY